MVYYLFLFISVCPQNYCLLLFAYCLPSKLFAPSTTHLAPERRRGATGSFRIERFVLNPEGGAPTKRADSCSGEWRFDRPWNAKGQFSFSTLSTHGTGGHLQHEEHFFDGSWKRGMKNGHGHLKAGGTRRRRRRRGGGRCLRCLRPSLFALSYSPAYSPHLTK